jgi:hypothetical protein
MSIAADEAEKEIYRSCLEGCAATAIFAFQNGYVAGRTAEPTEAEIEAAARVFFGNLHHPSASLDWDKAADHVKDNWRIKTRLALEAARKAVMA